MTTKSKLVLPSLAAAWLGFVSPASAAQTDTYGMHAVPVPGKVSIDGDLVVTLVVVIILMAAILVRIAKKKPIHGWPLVAVGWTGSGSVILVNKLLRPEMDIEGAILAVMPILFIITALPLLSKKCETKMPDIIATPPHSPTPVRVPTVSGAADAKANC